MTIRSTIRESIRASIASSVAVSSGGGGGGGGPSIIQQPASATITEGNDHTFSVIASGTGTLIYQWQEYIASVWEVVIGETASTFELTVDIGDDGRIFRVVVTDDVGSVNSNSVTLTVNSAEVPDYIVTDNAEFDAAVTAHTGSELIAISGTNFTQRTINGKSGLRITSLNSGSALPSLALAGTINGLELLDLNFQMTGWPANHNGCIEFGTGNFSNLDFNGGTWRHGYGIDNDPFDMEFTYPEYTRPDDIRNASTTSQRFVLDWEDPASTGGQVFFFNNGATNVYVKVGNSSVVATTSDTLVAVGSEYARLIGRNPTVDTHWAVIAVSGTPQVNARAEIGMANYVTSGFVATGSSVISNLTIRNIHFEDLDCGIKGWGTPSGYVHVVDNQLRRIYQDIIAGAVAPGTEYIVARNTYDIPFAKSGIAQGLGGDAGDPHGDASQIYANGVGTLGPVYSAGNRALNLPKRAGVVSQGIFWSDNDYNPSFNNLFSISDLFLCTAPNGICFNGEPAYPIVNGFIYGTTLIDSTNLTTGSPKIRPSTSAAPSGVVIDKSITCGYTTSAGNLWKKDCVVLNTTASPAAVFPDVGDVPTANSRAEIEAALTPAAEGAGLGAVATSNAIDWVTDDPTAIILWDNIPAGVVWDNATEVAISTSYEFPLRKVMNRKASQTVIAGSGVEWRSVDTDGVTQVQAWTTSSGTINPDQFIQIRKTSSASDLTAVIATVTINGFDISPTITTQALLVNGFRLDGTSYFQDTVNVPASTTVIEWEMKIKASTYAGSTTYIAQVVSDAILAINIVGGITLTVEDSAGTMQLNTGLFGQSLTAGVVQIVNCKVDFDNLLATISVNGTQVYSGAIPSSPGLNSFQTTRKISFGGATQQIKANTDVQYLKVWRTTSGTRTLHKEISVAALGSVANINSDAWKVGGTVTATP